MLGQFPQRKLWELVDLLEVSDLHIAEFIQKSSHSTLSRSISEYFGTLLSERRCPNVGWREGRARRCTRADTDD